jgi:hypothetical protein
MPRYVSVFALLLVIGLPAGLGAQGTRFGIAFGPSFVGGGDSRTLVDFNGSNVTGADQSGLHFRAFAEFPLSAPTLSFRTEVFYNTLHSRPNTYAVVNNGTGATALTDRTFGLTGNFVATLKPEASVTPFFLLGMGVFGSMLGTNPDPMSSQVTATRGGMGLGLQAGMGMRARLSQRSSLLFEWRYGQALNNTRGAGFMPLTVGVTF